MLKCCRCETYDLWFNSALNNNVQYIEQNISGPMCGLYDTVTKYPRMAGFTALHYAILRGNVQIIKLLLPREARLCTNAELYHNNFLLHVNSNIVHLSFISNLPHVIQLVLNFVQSKSAQYHKSNSNNISVLDVFFACATKSTVHFVEHGFVIEEIQNKTGSKVNPFQSALQQKQTAVFDHLVKNFAFLPPDLRFACSYFLNQGVEVTDCGAEVILLKKMTSQFVDEFTKKKLIEIDAIEDCAEDVLFRV
ncbi:Conserved_hypothetical protein [Hexamita inflata]|uniref:Uncharacterized protein n=1 Tax=Hexamita inflata TaxID=28002 RepID=A0AA86N5N0_9EUKA|nr:Conserved hypothetical protein [Hexamita inflata]